MIEPVPATLSDRDAVMGLRDTAAAWMVSRGIAQWVPGEITAATFEAQIASGEWWLLRDSRGIAGALRLLW